MFHPEWELGDIGTHFNLGIGPEQSQVYVQWLQIFRVVRQECVHRG